jgi:hypothetical protein
MKSRWAAAAAVLAALLAGCGGGGGGSPTPTFPPGLQGVDGDYTGILGDFRVNAGDLFAAKPCSASLGEFPPFPSDHRQSELWVDAFSPAAVPNFCADDDRLLAIFEYRDDAIIRRGYFYELPLVVSFNQLRDPPALLQIGDHEAIVGIDAPGSEQVYLYAIDRLPEGDVPGIFVFVLGTDLNVAAATRLAAELMPPP